MEGSLLRDRILPVWLVLVGAALLSWGLSTASPGRPHVTASVVILIVAFTKVRLIGTYFMDLRKAPAALKTLFDIYCFTLCATMIFVFLAL